MKHLTCLVVVALALAIPHLARGADEKREEKPRFKGGELYSWKDEAGDWVFVLLDGTNRLKTEAEAKGAKTKVKGADELKKALGRLAEGEQVSWTHPINGFEFPPEATRKAIAKAAKDSKIELHVETQK